MPSVKRFENATAQKRAWDRENVDRFEIKINRHGPINKTVMQKAANSRGLSLAAFIMEAVAFYIPHVLGSDWLEKNGNTSGEK